MARRYQAAAPRVPPVMLGAECRSAPSGESPYWPIGPIDFDRVRSVYFESYFENHSRAPFEMPTERPSDLIPRRSERVTKRLPVSLVVKNQGNETTLMASTVNVSPHGLRVQPRRSLQPRQAVYALPGRGVTPSGYCRVVWVTQAEAGLEFLD